jgi:outer membrane protein
LTPLLFAKLYIAYIASQAVATDDAFLDSLRFVAPRFIISLTLTTDKEKVMRNLKLALFSCVSILLLSQAAIAQDFNTSIGLGLGMVPEYEGSEDYTAVPLLYARYNWDDGKYVMLKGNQLKGNILNKKIEFGPLLQYRMERGDVDNDQVDSMKDVDAAVEGGFFLTGRFGAWSASLEFAADVSGEHDGFLVTLGGNYRHVFSDYFNMTFGVSSTYASENYMDTYFGIDAGNRGSSTLQDYSVDDGGFKDVGLYVNADYKFTECWSVVGNLGYKYLLNDAADSPIVEDEGNENQFYLGLMGVYRF